MASAPIINFSPGPGKLPKAVLDKAAKEFPAHPDYGVSITEMWHVKAPFKGLMKETELLVREVLSVPENYEVLFLGGGCTAQFAGVPLNLGGSKAAYAVTGYWSEKAAREASNFIDVVPAFPPLKQFDHIPALAEWKIPKDSSYVWYCSNETIHGLEFDFLPGEGGIPVIVDASSSLLSSPLDVSKHGIVLAGAHKNLGIAGLCLGLIRKDMLGKCRKTCPMVLNYTEQARMGSCMNTPPTFAIYIMKLMLEWVKEEGGAEAMFRLAEAKSQLLYKLIDGSEGFYTCPVSGTQRSRVNVVFRISHGAELEKKFVEEAEKRGMRCLDGHPLYGGLRASLYNAVTLEETQTLAAFMQDFMERERK